MMRLWFNRDTRHEHGGAMWAVLRLAIITCTAALAIIAIGEALRTDVPDRFITPSATIADPLAADLARCRDITTEQLAADDTCRRVWAANRRRFFAPTASVARTSDAPPNTQDRNPTPITPNLSDEAR
jgi:conjugative transfer region protein TrbK